MKNKFKKLTSLLLASIMMLVALPIQTLAAEWGKGDTVYAAMIGDFSVLTVRLTPISTITTTSTISRTVA